ncbi:hypothetical protein [Rhizobium nepotum]|uniref:hypothetical protein n=1 Tax=Rhizobium nepotum TaxID=1035271 RepID=UPI003CFA0F98
MELVLRDLRAIALPGMQRTTRCALTACFSSRPRNAEATRIVVVIGKNDQVQKPLWNGRLIGPRRLCRPGNWDLLRSTSEGHRWSTDYCTMRLTIAIIEALIEARNFEQAPFENVQKN